MNTPNPLVPQGTLPSRGKTSFFFKVLMILTVHVVLIGGMLLQGCKDTKDTASNPQSTDNNSTASTSSADSLPPVTAPAGSNVATAPGPQTAPPAAPASVPPMTQSPVSMPPSQPTVAAPVTPIAPPVAPIAPPVAAPSTGDMKEYVIASGDTLGALARRNGVSLKTLLEANPGVNPKRLHVGQKVQIPGSSSAVASTASAAGTAPDISAGSGDATVYTVKTGDTLSKIAKANHTSYKKIMALNDLKTTSIKAGQKLKLPAAKMASTETSPAPAAPAAVVPLQPAPAATTTAAASPGSSSN